MPKEGCWRGLTERGEIRSEEGWPGEVGKGGLRISKGVNQRDILGGLKDYYTRCLRIRSPIQDFCVKGRDAVEKLLFDPVRLM